MSPVPSTIPESCIAKFPEKHLKAPGASMACRRLPNFDQVSVVRELGGKSGNAPLRNNAFMQKFKDNKTSLVATWWSIGPDSLAGAHIESAHG